MLTFRDTILLWCVDATSLVTNALESIKSIKFELGAIVTANHFDLSVELIFYHVDELDKEIFCIRFMFHQINPCAPSIIVNDGEKIFST